MYYAIGDIHGESVKLDRLLARIRRDAAGRPYRIAVLGDIIDKGPDSAGAVRRVRMLESAGAVVLKGNHEAMAVRARAGTQRAHWLSKGGDVMIESYRGDTARLESDLDWMEGLPTRHVTPDGRFVFVHAGLDPEGYPNGSEVAHLWTRTDAFMASEAWTNPALEGVTVVHGHTPSSTEPDVSADGRRINVDTHACKDGPLTAAVCVAGEPVRFIRSG